ncbi:MAG: PadR family transcriptional regulator [Acidobacteriota bacterium]|jgi:transcriptional regulator
MASNNIIQGTLDLLILKALREGPQHGYGIGKWIRATTEGALEIGEGALYPALHRMRLKGWLRAEMRPTETGRRAKFYRLTDAGEEQLAAELARWEEYTRAVAMVVDVD